MTPSLTQPQVPSGEGEAWQPKDLAKLLRANVSGITEDGCREVDHRLYDAILRTLEAAPPGASPSLRQGVDVPEELRKALTDIRSRSIQGETYAGGIRPMLRAIDVFEGITKAADDALALLARSDAAPDAVGDALLVHKVLRAIAEGYPVKGEKDRFVIVENPDFREDDGSDPNLVIDVAALARAETSQGQGGQDNG